MTESALRIAMVEDDRNFRRAVEFALDITPDMELCATYPSVESLLAGLRDPRAMAGGWHVVLMDISLPGDSGIQGIRYLKARFPHVRVLVVTAFQDSGTIVDAIHAGADGYCVKGTQLPELLERVRAVAAGGASYDATTVRNLVEVVRDRVPETDGGAPARVDLTPRERDVLRCLVDGDSYKSTADRLGMSVHTVRTHVRSVYKKLDVQSAAAAVGRAVRERLV